MLLTRSESSAGSLTNSAAVRQAERTTRHHRPDHSQTPRAFQTIICLAQNPLEIQIFDF